MYEIDTAATVGIKILAFIETAASAGWFAIIKAQNLHTKNNEHRDKILQCSVGPATWTGNENPGVHFNKKYEDLKEAVIKSYEKTKPELFEKRINDTRITSRLSHYLQKLMTTADKVGMGEDLVRHRFTQAMPSTI